MIFPGTQQELYPVWRLAGLGILHISWVCTTLQPHSIGGLWVEQQQCLLPIELLDEASLFASGSTLQSRIVTEANILSVLDDHCVGIPLARKLTYSLYCDDFPWLSAVQRLECRYNSQWCSTRPMVVNAVMTKETFSSLLTTFSRQCAWLLCGIWYVYPDLWRKLIVR